MSNFKVTSQTGKPYLGPVVSPNDGVSELDGEVYDGPVSGIASELDLHAETGGLSVYAQTSDCFIVTGSGEDYIRAYGGGTNVLDGGLGSNFLVGSDTGTNQFYLDARDTSSVSWSTVANMHPGDTVTAWGVRPGDFWAVWADGLGAEGAKGLTMEIIDVSNPTQSAYSGLTLSGLTLADRQSGRLGVNFGRTPDTAWGPGSDYFAATLRY